MMRSNEDVMMMVAAAAAAVVSFIVQVFLSRANESQYSSGIGDKGGPSHSFIHSLTRSIFIVDVVFFRCALLYFAMQYCLWARARTLPHSHSKGYRLTSLLLSKKWANNFSICDFQPSRAEPSHPHGHIRYAHWLEATRRDRNNNNAKTKNKPNTNKFQFVRLQSFVIIFVGMDMDTVYQKKRREAEPKGKMQTYTIKRIKSI